MTTNEMIRVAVFEGKHIRKIIHEGEWRFSVIDIVEVLTGSDRPRKYWNDLKKGSVEVSEKIGQLKMKSPDGRRREGYCFQKLPNRKIASNSFGLLEQV